MTINDPSSPCPSPKVLHNFSLVYYICTHVVLACTWFIMQVLVVQGVLQICFVACTLHNDHQKI